MRETIFKFQVEKFTLKTFIVIVLHDPDEEIYGVIMIMKYQRYFVFVSFSILMKFSTSK